MWHWLGRVPFAEAAALQEKLRSDIGDHRAPETLLLLEHHPVVTLGKSARRDNVLASETSLAARGIELHRASRGGDVTYHGPGQLVGYPMVRLRAGVRAHIEGMAAAIREVLGELGIMARYRKEAPGLWVDGPTGPAKICAFGVNVHHRITIHGFALNLDPDLDAFRLIVPCGIVGCAVTSVRACREVTGTPAPAPKLASKTAATPTPTPFGLSARVAAALGSHLGVTFASGSASEIAKPGEATTMTHA